MLITTSVYKSQRAVGIFTYLKIIYVSLIEKSMKFRCTFEVQTFIDAYYVYYVWTYFNIEIHTDMHLAFICTDAINSDTGIRWELILHRYLLGVYWSSINPWLDSDFLDKRFWVQFLHVEKVVNDKIIPTP